MKNLFYRLTAFILFLVMLAGTASALAVHTTYTDIKGHWAEAVLIRALNDALIEGSGDKLNPDSPITGGEIVSLLCRVLSADRTVDISGVTDITENDPYYTAASQAVALGILTPVNGRLNLNKPVTRSKAFTQMAEAFQLIKADQDTSALSEFSDGNTLSGKYRLAVSALVSGGYVGGFNGSLHINRNITRAEFLTVFYKLLPNYLLTEKYPGAVTGGSVFSDNTSLTDTQFTGNAYFDCSTTGVQLQNVTAPAVVLRGDHPGVLSVTSSKIDRLVFASFSGDRSYFPDASSDINTVAVGTGAGKMTLGGNIPAVEITGTGRTVTISGQVKNLYVSGTDNKIIIASGASVEAIKILGEGNTLTVNGTSNACDIFGAKTVVDGSGTINTLIDNTKNSTVTAETASETNNADYGLNNAALSLNAPDELSPYETLKVSVSISAPAGSKICRGTWYIDDIYISQSEVNVGKDASVTLNTKLPLYSDNPELSTLSYVLSYINPDGAYQEIRADKAVTLLNPAKLDAKQVLALVKTGYKGDYTLEWTQAHDYSDAVKTEWVNQKGYSSKTRYLVWVSVSHQRVNIFTGSSGKWVLDRSFIIGTGASGNDTPVGVFKIIGRNTKGWNAKTYTVKPLIFFINLAYAFHSRLYKPGTTTISDPRIGFPVSHGCIRMYDEDVAWFYDNIPTNTTVVVY